MKVDSDNQTLPGHTHNPLHDPQRILQGPLGRDRPSAAPKSLPQLLQQVESEQPQSSGSDSVHLLLEYGALRACSKENDAAPPEIRHAGFVNEFGVREGRLQTSQQSSR